MKISYNWLKEYINIDKPAEEIAENLTNIGLEVSGMEQIGVDKNKLKALKIGKVLEKEKHPDADRLNVAMVDLGEAKPAQIVCGAVNLEINQKVVVAPVDSKIYPIDGSEIKIKKAKLRGVESFGMICAEDEIGIGASHEGIIVLDENAPVGKSFADYFQAESDVIFEVDLTPNRSDAVSHYGVARDLKAFYHSDEKIKLRFPELLANENENLKNEIDIQLPDTELCPRYSGVVVKNIKVQPSPENIQNKLRSIGIKPINNIVDITNFVLHELGQPLHAFEKQKIKGNRIIVQTCNEGEKFITLDSEERKLSANDLMICNAEKPMCIAGVFGGKDSGVSGETTEIFIESAYFNAASVRKTAKYHKLSTDASFRYERGADPNITVRALQRAIKLIKEDLPDASVSEIKDVYPNKINSVEIELEVDYLNKTIGQELDFEAIVSILEALEMKPKTLRNEKAIKVTVPTYRVDVTRPIDVVEEIIRIYGFNQIDIPTQIKIPLQQKGGNLKEKLKYKLALMLQSKGFSEIMTNSLTSNKNIINENEKVEILNALSNELNVMRQSPIMSDLEAIAYNINRNNNDLKFFEIGKSYFKKAAEKYVEREQLTLFLTGNEKAQTWEKKGEKVDFYLVKALLQAILTLCNNKKEVKLEQTNNELYDFATEIKIDNKPAGVLGQLSDKLLKRQGIEQSVFALEIDFSALLKIFAENDVTYKEVSKFPIVKRDLALLVKKDIQFAQLKDIAEKAIGSELQEIGLFDDYQGKGIPEDRKSYGLNFSFRKDDKTYTDKEIDALMERLMSAYKKEVTAEIRE